MEICDGAPRGLVDETRDDIELESTWDPKGSEAVGLRGAEYELSNAIGCSGEALWWECGMEYLDYAGVDIAKRHVNST